MPFYKWKAYDFDLKYFEGVIECERFELVVIEVTQKELVPKEIVVIDYPEYKRYKAVEKRMQAIERKKAKLKPNKIKLKHKKKFDYKKLWPALIPIGIVLLILLAWSTK